MITHLCLEFLGAGELPLYDMGPEHLRWFVLSENLLWEPRLPWANALMVIPSSIDTMLEEVEPQLRQWFEDADGTLFFPIQGCAAIPGGEGTLLVAGAAYVPDTELGIPLEEADPVDLILQACREIRFGEVMPANLTDYHPVLQQAWRSVTWPDNERAPHLPGVNFAQDFRDQERKAAETRAKVLLCSILTGDQLCEMEALEQFHVQGADGHTYLIRKGYGHNVWRIEDGRKTVEYCLITRGHVPVYDLMLTQKLLLETDPEHFQQKANSLDLVSGRAQRESLVDVFRNLVGGLRSEPRPLVGRPIPGAFVQDPEGGGVEDPANGQ